MAAQMTEPIPGPVDWSISTASFAPPSTHRVVRGWDRAPVSAHAPRLHGKTVWKKFLLKASETETDDAAVQEELNKAGTGARKKFRSIGAKTNITDAIWDETNFSDQQSLVQLPNASEPVQSESLADNPTKTTEVSGPVAAETTSELLNASFPSIEFIPRKRTNTNHVITPKKPMRQSTLDEVSRRKSFHRASKGGASRPRKSLRKSSRRSTLVNTKEANSDLRTMISENLGKSDIDEISNELPTAQNEDEGTELSSTPKGGLRRSLRLARSSLLSNDERSQSQSTPPKDAQSPFKFTIVVSTEGLALNNDFIAPSTLTSEPEIAASPTVLSMIDIERAPDSSLEVPPTTIEETEDEALKPESVQLEVPVTYSSDVPTTEENSSGTSSVQEDFQHELDDDNVQNPFTPSLDIVIQQETDGDTVDAQAENERSEDLAVLSEAVLDVEADKSSATDLQREILTISVSTELETSVEIDIPGTPKTSMIQPHEVVPEVITENADELEDPDLMTSDLVEAISKNSPATTHYDHDDTDMLRNFLTRVKANKAAKRSSPRRKRSLPHSPLRIPLGDVDTNLSPSQAQSNAENDPSGTPLKNRSRQGNPLVLEDETPEPRSCRRSGRTRLPVKSQTPPGAPSFIPVRRLGQEADTTVTLKKNEEKELAALTRVNTRKNKAGALPALEVLARKADEKEDPAQRQKLLKEVFDEKIAKEKQEKDKKGRRKTVTWAEELAQYQEIKDSKGQAKKDQKGKDTAGPAVEEKKQGAVRVGVRSKVALGMAMNGTPAPKRTMRSRQQ